MSATSSSPGAVEEQYKKWIPILELASQEVFELMLGSHLVVAPVPVADDLVITAMVGLAGVLCGVLTIRCSSKAAAKMASKMLGIEAQKPQEEIWDALGEVCNMIAGNFKNKVSGLGDGCMLSVPTVITGNDYECHSFGETNNLQVEFRFEDEGIIIALEIHS